MIQPYKLAVKIKESKDYKVLLLANYIEYSNGLTMQQYADLEKRTLSTGSHGVEDFHYSVKSYIEFLNSIIE